MTHSPTLERPALPQAEDAESPTAARILGLRGVSASLRFTLLSCLRLRGGTMVMRLPAPLPTFAFGDGRGAHVVLQVHDTRFAEDLLRAGDIGFAESFVDGAWSSPDLAGLLTFLASNQAQIRRIFVGAPLFRLINRLRHAMRKNSRTGARKNIYEHYDLGNDFYALWLDKSMTYSSGMFRRAHETLEEAQHNKYEALCEALDLKSGEKILEIGCGWGGFAEYAAKTRGAHVTGLTISEAQFAYASRRIAAASLNDRVTIKLQDYRDADGVFDKVASIEMFEAVGERYWPAYFAKVAAVLRPGGRAALQIITIDDALFESYRQRMDFIQRYVFPGGMLPSVTRLKEETAAAGLRWRGYEAFAQDYAATLHEWDRRFQAVQREVSAQGFDAAFQRLWRFYLAYCEAGFRAGRTDVVQLVLDRP